VKACREVELEEPDLLLGGEVAAWTGRVGLVFFMVGSVCPAIAYLNESIRTFRLGRDTVLCILARVVLSV
jgi:hypothetical protein